MSVHIDLDDPRHARNSTTTLGEVYWWLSHEYYNECRANDGHKGARCDELLDLSAAFDRVYFAYLAAKEAK